MSDQILDKINRTIESKRYHLGLTQTKLAKTLGMTQPAISQYLTGKVPLNTDFIIKLANALKVPPTELDPGLQQVLFLAKRKRIIPVINDNSSRELFADENALGFKIPCDTYAPRYVKGDILIFRELLPDAVQPGLHLLLYNHTDHHIGRCTDTLQIDGIEHPYENYRIGLIEQIVPS